MMDPLQRRLHLLAQLKGLAASQASILAISATFSPYSPDLWECLLDALAAASLHARLNAVFLVDALLPAYTELLQRDGVRLVDVVLDSKLGREAIWNLPPLVTVLAKWKEKGVRTDAMETRVRELEPELRCLKRTGTQDPLRRIEEDRERHKRLREGSWIVPPPFSSSEGLFFAFKDEASAGEFAKAWDETSSLNEDDFERMRDEIPAL